MMLIYILIALPLVYVLRKQVRTLVTKMFKAAAPEGAPPVVTISSGQVEGELCYSGNGSRVFSSFNGIPFAKPPLGKYRFLRPQPVDKVSKCNSISWIPTKIRPDVFLPCLSAHSLVVRSELTTSELELDELLQHWACVSDLFRSENCLMLADADATWTKYRFWFKNISNIQIG